MAESIFAEVWSAVEVGGRQRNRHRVLGRVSIDRHGLRWQRLVPWGRLRRIEVPLRDLTQLELHVAR